MERVLQGLGSLNMGGAETMVVNVLENLDRENLMFDFVIPGAEEGMLEPRVNRLGAKVYHTPKRSENLIESYRAFERVIRENEYKTVHLHTQNAFLTAPHVFLARRAGAQTIIVHIHNTMDWRSGMALRLHPYCRKWLYRNADVRLACGREAGAWLFGTENGVEVLPLPVQCDKLQFDAARQAALKRDAGLTGKTVYLHVGRFMEVKNHDFVVKIFAELHRRQPDSVLLLVGDGELRPAVEAQVKEAGLTGAVHFLGNISDVPDKMVLADVLLFPSKYEGFPTVLLEAQAAGLECFVSDTITPEVRLTGRVHPLPLTSSAAEWADAVLAEPRSADRAADNAAVRQKYDVSVVTKRLMELYTGPLLKGKET